MNIDKKKLIEELDKLADAVKFFGEYSVNKESCVDIWNPFYFSGINIKNGICEIAKVLNLPIKIDEDLSAFKNEWSFTYKGVVFSSMIDKKESINNQINLLEHRISRLEEAI